MLRSNGWFVLERRKLPGILSGLYLVCCSRPEQPKYFFRYNNHIYWKQTILLTSLPLSWASKLDSMIRNKKKYKRKLAPLDFVVQHLECTALLTSFNHWSIKYWVEVLAEYFAVIISPVVKINSYLVAVKKILYKDIDSYRLK